MRNHLRRSILIASLCVLTSAGTLTGCGKRDAALDTYKANMETYFSSAANINSRINSIDVSNATTEGEIDAAHEELLTSLDQLDTITTQMAELEVPEQFSLNESLADEAAENMSEAVALYHQLYEADEYNEGIAEGAYEYYERANKRIVYIRSILQGDIPEDLDIEYEDTEDADTDSSDMTFQVTETE